MSRMTRPFRDRRSVRLGVGVAALSLVLVGCGGGKSSSSTGPRTVTGNLKQLELEVTRNSTAQGPVQTFLAAMFELVVGRPRIAEADTGFEGCAVTVDGVVGTFFTDKNGKVFISNVPNPGTAHIDCGADGTADIPYEAPSGATTVRIKVEARPGKFTVKANQGEPSPSASGPPSPPNGGPLPNGGPGPG